VHVISNAAFSHVASIEAALSDSETEAREKVETDMADEAFRWLTTLWQNTTKHGKLEVDIPHGVPGDEILRIAKDFDAQLIVIGRYGIGRIVPAILGSVVSSVVHGADCPVLVVADP
jgi:nucleotide-binding universal stress UspA family protein